MIPRSRNELADWLTDRAQWHADEQSRLLNEAIAIETQQNMSHAELWAARDRAAELRELAQQELWFAVALRVERDQIETTTAPGTSSQWRAGYEAAKREMTTPIQKQENTMHDTKHPTLDELLDRETETVNAYEREQDELHAEALEQFDRPAIRRVLADMGFDVAELPLVESDNGYTLYGVELRYDEWYLRAGQRQYTSDDVRMHVCPAMLRHEFLTHIKQLGSFSRAETEAEAAMLRLSYGPFSPAETAQGRAETEAEAAREDAALAWAEADHLRERVTELESALPNLYDMIDSLRKRETKLESDVAHREMLLNNSGGIPVTLLADMSDLRAQIAELTAERDRLLAQVADLADQDDRADELMTRYAEETGALIYSRRRNAHEEFVELLVDIGLDGLTNVEALSALSVDDVRVLREGIEASRKQNYI